MTRAEIVLTHDERQLGLFHIEPGEYLLGSDRGCELHVAAPQLAHRHARLTFDGVTIRLEDLETKPGTSTALAAGQPAKLGAARLTFRLLGAIERTLDSTATQSPRRPPEPAPQVRPSDPTTLKPRNYLLGAEIARGGMGAIRSADDLNIQRTVAMKVMLPRGAESQDSQLRFLQEAKLTGQLEHPNIVPVHELGVDEHGQPFYTMKLVQGVTLHDVLAEIKAGDAATIAKFPLAALLTVFQKICDAIAFAHSKHIIHRDLKPENIMLGDYGEVLVMDWGLAKVLRPDAPVEPAHERAGDDAESSKLPLPDDGLTLDGTIMGSPQFMAPEQAAGKIAELDTRTDLFALGGLLYNILALQPPVDGATTQEVLDKVRTGQIAPPNQPAAAPLPHCPNRQVPDSLAAVAMKALALRREDRYQTVAELQQEITAYQTGFATRAENASFAKQIGLLIKRNQREFAIGLAAWCVITTLSVWFVIKVTAEKNRATRNAELAAANEQKAVREKDAAQRSFAKSQIALAESAYHDRDGRAMIDALNNVPERLRDLDWRYLLERADSSVATIRSRAHAEIKAATAHPTKPGVFAVIGVDGWVSLVEARTGVRYLEFQPGFKNWAAHEHQLAFSPDAERLAVTDTAQVWLYNAHNGTLLRTWECKNVNLLQFSPDGRQVLAVVDNQQLTAYDPGTGTMLWSKPLERSLARAIFSTDGTRILATFGPAAKKLQLLSAADGHLIREFSDSPHSISGLAIRPDGRQALIGDEANFVRCLDLETGQILYETLVSHDPTAGQLQLAYTPDGSRFVTAAEFAGNRLSLQIWDAHQGTLLHRLLGGSSGNQHLCLHPLSGELLVYGDVAKVWLLPPQAEKWRLTARIDARTIAFWGTDDLIFRQGSDLVELSSGTSSKPIWNPSGGNYRVVSVSADGRFAAIAQPEGSHIKFLRRNANAVEEVRAFQAQAPAWAVHLSPNGERLWLDDKLYDPATGAEVVRLAHAGNMPTIINRCWLTNQRLVAAVIANARRGQPGSEDRFVLWDATTGQQLRSTASPTVINCAAAAPDGRSFAEAGSDRMVRLRDAATLAVTKEFRAHDGPITALAFHPTRHILATASEDLTVKLWDLATGRCLDELHGPLAAPKWLAFSPSGKRVACLSLDRTTRIWEPDALSLLPRDPDGWQDLLAPLTPAAVAETSHGSWRMDHGLLLSTFKVLATVPLTGDFPASGYQVRIKLRQLHPVYLGFRVFLPLGQGHVKFALDSALPPNCRSGVYMFGYQSAIGTALGQQLRDSELHELELSVQPKDAIVRMEAQLDGQPLFHWNGLITLLNTNSIWGYGGSVRFEHNRPLTEACADEIVPIPRGILVLGSWQGFYVVYSVQLKRLAALP